MRKKPKYLRNYEKVLLELEPFIESIREVELKRKANIKPILVSAFTKCFDYNLYNSQSREYESSFYKLSTLRSLCEDLISITFLLKLDTKTRNNHIQYLQNFYLHKSIIVQNDFFTEHNPSQIVVPVEVIPKKNIDFVKNKPNYRDKAKRKGHFDLPSVYKMAEEANFLSLYKYLYYATSSIVHFRPDILLKTGWGDLDENKKLSKVTFNVKHYNKYYHSFNTFYAWYILVLQYESFKKYLKIPKSQFEIIKDFNNKLKRSDWPELTTFEHLNMKGPNDYQRMMKRFMIEMMKKENNG